MRFNKKGDSTIIAVVLLTVIVVALGALLFTFFRGQVLNAQEKTAQKMDQAMCGTDLTISVETVNNTKGTHNDQNVYTFYVTAGAENDVNGLLITAVAQNVLSIPMDDVKISRAQTVPIQVDLSNMTGTLAQVKITPESVTNGKKLICTDSAIVVDAADIS